MAKFLIVTIDPDGSIKTSVEGACGPECEELARPYEENLGKVTKKTLTKDYYAGEQEKQGERVRR